LPTNLAAVPSFFSSFLVGAALPTVFLSAVSASFLTAALLFLETLAAAAASSSAYFLAKIASYSFITFSFST